MVFEGKISKILAYLSDEFNNDETLEKHAMIYEIKLQTKRRDEMLDITAQVSGK